MNLLLLNSDAFTGNIASVQGRQLKHMLEVHRAKLNDRIRVGCLGGKMGLGTIVALNDEAASIEVILDEAPPEKLPLTLLLGLPRPKMLKRTLQTVTAMGVERVILLNTYRVEKSYWQTPLLSEEAIFEQVTLGLEQARDTIPPIIELEKRVKPFVEDRLPAIIGNDKAFVAHPHTDMATPADLNERICLAVGPEGGFIPYEVEKLNEAGCISMHMGARILKVETAVPALLARLFSY